MPYGRKGIDDFVAAVERQPELWDRVVPQLDERLKRGAALTWTALTARQLHRSTLFPSHPHPWLVLTTH